MNLKNLIEELGGNKQVGNEVGVEPAQVSRWIATGKVSPQYYPDLLKLAKANIEKAKETLETLGKLPDSQISFYKQTPNHTSQVMIRRWESVRRK